MMATYNALAQARRMQIKAKAGGNKNPINQWWDEHKLDEYEHRAWVASDYNIERYRDFMENYTVVEVAHVYYGKIVHTDLMNG